MRRIVRERQFEKIEGKRVDMQTAQMVITVYDGLSEKNKSMYSNLKLNEMVGLGWEIIRRAKKKGKVR